MTSCVHNVNAYKNKIPVTINTIHDKNPVITRIEHVLDSHECNYIIDLANEIGYARSKVISDGNRTESSARTSSTCYIDKGKNEIVSCIEKKIAAVAQQPHEDLEGLQVTRYVNGQEYKAHHDWFYSPRHTQRSATVFTYLKGLSPGCGGATAFPNLKHDDGTILRSHPHTGDALVWKNLTQMGQPDKDTLHAGESITCGEEKIGLNAWFGSSKYIYVSNDTYYINVLIFIILTLLLLYIFY